MGGRAGGRMGGRAVRRVGGQAGERLGADTAGLSKHRLGPPRVANNNHGKVHPRLKLPHVYAALLNCVNLCRGGVASGTLYTATAIELGHERKIVRMDVHH